jgi:tRNA pseudouridine38-40 synthase
VRLQIQPTKGTIENELFDAMHKVGIITDENHERVQTAQFQRCARTDKGVHAARQVVSLKLAVDTPDIPGLLNAVLPPQIRVQACVAQPQFVPLYSTMFNYVLLASLVVHAAPPPCKDYSLRRTLISLTGM